MNKTSLVFTAVGLIVLIVAGYILFKPKQEPTNNQTNQQTPNQSVTEPPPPALVEAIFEYHKDMEMEPKTVRVAEGQKVVIKVTSDVADEAHLHGYDISVEVKPGEQSQLEFTADKTGRFPVEMEELKKDIGVIEIYPK